MRAARWGRRKRKVGFTDRTDGSIAGFSIGDGRPERSDAFQPPVRFFDLLALMGQAPSMRVRAHRAEDTLPSAQRPMPPAEVSRPGHGAQEVNVPTWTPRGFRRCVNAPVLATSKPRKRPGQFDEVLDAPRLWP